MEFVLNRDVCKRCKHETIARPGLLQPLGVPTQAWDDITMNFVEGLPRSEGKNCILVVVDRLTKFSHFLGLSHPFSAQEVARIFVDRPIEWLIYMECPKLLFPIEIRCLPVFLANTYEISRVQASHVDGLPF